ncbi:hypothetical protein LCGC14_2973870, partial [marine sediment metagenome]
AYRSLIDHTSFGFDPGDRSSERVESRFDAMLQSGLLDEVRDATRDMATIDAQLSDWMDQYEADVSLYLAGSSVHFDRSGLIKTSNTRSSFINATTRWRSPYQTSK